jgi:hypothetical protein
VKGGVHVSQFDSEHATIVGADQVSALVYLYTILWT